VTPNSGTGDNTIDVTVTSNAGATVSRQTDLTIAGQTVAISQAGLTCTYGLQSTTGSVPAPGASGAVGVVAPGICGWTATAESDSGWLAVVSPAGASAGSSNVLFSALPNGLSSSRVGTITIHPADLAIAPKVYTVTQAGAPCSYDLSPTGSSGIDPAGTPSALFGFTATNGCGLPAPVSYAGWAHVVATSGGGVGTIEYSVDPNLTSYPRSTTIRVGDKNFAISQAGGSCGYSLNAYGSVFGKSGGVSSVLASATLGTCTPDLGTTQSFITLGSLSGSPVLFTLPFTVAPYNSLNVSVRFGKITFGGQVHTVKQTSW
jgi:hypothetical protein